MKKFFTVRFLSGLIYFLIAAPLLLFFYDTFILNMVIAVISSRIVYEIIRVSAIDISKMHTFFFCAFAALVPLLQIDYKDEAHTVFVIYSFLMGMIIWYLLRFDKLKLEQYSVLMFFALVLPVFLTCALWARSMHNGQFYLILIFAGTWCSDVMAQVCGKTFGKHKLGTSLSPNKTKEGCVGSVICNALLFLVMGMIFNRFFGLQVTLLKMTVVGAFVSIAAQMGDLIASALKRTYGVKDFSNLIPGHGGMYDRFDSFAIVAPTLYISVKFLDFLGSL